MLIPYFVYFRLHNSCKSLPEVQNTSFRIIDQEYFLNNPVPTASKEEVQDWSMHRFDPY
jgi:hypothetical protein